MMTISEYYYLLVYFYSFNYFVYFGQFSIYFCYPGSYIFRLGHSFMAEQLLWTYWKRNFRKSYLLGLYLMHSIILEQMVHSSCLSIDYLFYINQALGRWYLSQQRCHLIHVQKQITTLFVADHYWVVASAKGLTSGWHQLCQLGHLDDPDQSGRCQHLQHSYHALLVHRFIKHFLEDGHSILCC